MIISLDTIAFLLSLAIKFTGLPGIPVDQLPPMVPVSAAELTSIVCPEDAKDCRGMIAMFDDDSYRIIYLNTLDTENSADNSFILHEIVHVLQYKAKGKAIYANCRALVETERQAYKAQNEYLKREGVFMQVGEILRFVTCPPE